MEKHLDEKSLMVVKEKSIFYRIKSFFLKLFRKNAITENQTQITDEENYEVQSNKQKDSFVEYIRNIENEETKLLKLQKQYDNRLIETNDLSKDQIKELINLYKKQISELRKSNEIRKEKLLLYRKNMQSA